MTLQDKLDAFKADFVAGKPPYNVPAPVIATMQRATDALIASGAAARSPAELLARGPLAVSFYRGVWCPYCNMELQALQEVLPQLQQAGASMVAISPQLPANSRKAMRQNGLEFPILSDAGNEVAAAFGLRFTLPDYLVELYRSLKNELPAFNGDASWTLPMPARYVIAPDGVIVYAEVNPDYTRRPDPSDMLPAIARAIG